MNLFVGIIEGGFGNKIFDLLILLYLQYINSGKIYIIIKKSEHELVHDKYIFDIFNKLKSEFIILDDINQYTKIEDQIDIKNRLIFNCKEIRSINDFNIDKKYKAIFVSKIYNCYKYIYDIYNNLPYKKIFSINEEIISKNILEITKNKYMVIHIRYGDKLKFAFENDNRWILYSPQFYKYIINKFIKKKINIYIITDDIHIVQKFILDGINYDNIRLLDIPWWDAFYCLTKSRYTILSISTFSFMATLLNTNLKKAYIVLRPNDPKFNKCKIPEENIIEHTNWKKFNDNKYILNYNKNLMKSMLDYKESFNPNT